MAETLQKAPEQSELDAIQATTETNSGQPTHYEIGRILAREVPDLNDPPVRTALKYELEMLDRSYNPNNYARDVLPEVDKARDMREKYANPAEFIAEANRILVKKYGNADGTLEDMDPVEWALAKNAPDNLAYQLYGERFLEYKKQREAIELGYGEYANGIPSEAEQSADFQKWEEEIAPSPETAAEQQETPELIEDNAAEAAVESQTPLIPTDEHSQERIRYWKEQFNPSEAPVQSPEIAPSTPDTLSDDPAAEIATLPDAEMRYKDAEILGKSYRVRQMIHELGNRYAAGLETQDAAQSNALEIPGKLREKFIVRRHQKKYNKAKKMLDMAEKKGLPENHYLMVRRKAAFTTAEARLQSAQKKLDTRNERMKDRKEAVHKNFEARRTEYITDLKNRKESALARKTLRHELIAQGATLSERKAILKEIPQEHLQRVGKLAAIAETSRRAHGQAEQTKQTADRLKEKVADDIKKNEEHIARYIEEANNAEKVLAELTDPGTPGSLPEK